MYKILIVEDDEMIANVLKKRLETWEFEVSLVNDFRHIIECFQTCSPQLVLLDISLPYYNGFYWCSRIRKISSVPIVYLSSASDNMNIVMAMNMGGDDFIAKPFEFSVLLAKLQAILRRTYEFRLSADCLSHRGIVFNTADASFTYEGKKIELTKNESRILWALMEKKGTIISRDVLMERLWETDSYVDENTLTVNVTRLRRKLEQAGVSDFITTKKGMGYLIE